MNSKSYARSTLLVVLSTISMSVRVSAALNQSDVSSLVSLRRNFHLRSNNTERHRENNQAKERGLYSQCYNDNQCGNGEFCGTWTYYGTYYGTYGTYVDQYCENCAACYLFGGTSVVEYSTSNQLSFSGSCPSKCSYASSCSALSSYALDVDYDYDYEDIGKLNEYFGSCDGVSVKSNQWCPIYGPDFSTTCHAFSESDCCQEPSSPPPSPPPPSPPPPVSDENTIDGLALAGLVIGTTGLIALIITLCVFLCKCCCFRPNPVTIMQQQPAQMQAAPQIVVVPTASPAGK